MLQTDRISLETRVVGALVVPVLLAAVVVLYVFPDGTATQFSWTILPRATAIVIGAGYAAGAYFFVRVVAEKRWHHVQAGFLSITIFTIAMLVATLLHWDRFHQGTFPFYTWTVIYLITPVLVPCLWWRNRATAAAALDESDLRFSTWARWLLGLTGAAGVLLSLLAFVQPSLLILWAPWKLTELTAQVCAGWSLLTFVAILMLGYDGRWSAARILLESAMVGQALALLALPRMWTDLDPTKITASLYVAGLALAFIALGVIHLWLDWQSRRRRRGAELLPNR